jgi:hypothetical protein
MEISVKIISLIFFLGAVLLFQIVTFSPIAVAQNTNNDIIMPSWFKTNAKWWEEGRISNTEILNAIENLLNKGIIKIDSRNIESETTAESDSSILPFTEDVGIPSYVKNIFVFWHQGLVSDLEVSNAIKYLVEEKIINTPFSVLKQPRPLAVIIDQLHDSIPNLYFQEKATQYLELAGYQVDIFTTQDITIDFYKNLPSMNYKYIVIRTHGLEDPKYNNGTFLFTGEKYSVNKFIPEQLSGQVGKGAPIYELERSQIKEEELDLDERMYFLVGSKLVDELMVGKFPDSVILIGGCESVRNKDLAKSLILRGASEIVGWDRTIGSIENDRIMLAFLEKTLVDKEKIQDAVIELNDKYSSDLQFSSELNYVYRT